jgi:hypothetical protein
MITPIITYRRLRVWIKQSRLERKIARYNRACHKLAIRNGILRAEKHIFREHLAKEQKWIDTASARHRRKMESRRRGNKY